MTGADAENVLDAHKQAWTPLTPWVEEQFAGYTNGTKLATLLEFWNFGLRSLIWAYGAPAAADYARHGVAGHLRYGYEHELGVPMGIPAVRVSRASVVALTGGLIPRAYLPVERSGPSGRGSCPGSPGTSSQRRA